MTFLLHITQSYEIIFIQVPILNSLIHPCIFCCSVYSNYITTHRSSCFNGYIRSGFVLRDIVKMWCVTTTILSQESKSWKGWCFAWLTSSWIHPSYQHFGQIAFVITSIIKRCRRNPSSTIQCQTNRRILVAYSNRRSIVFHINSYSSGRLIVTIIKCNILNCHTAQW